MHVVLKNLILYHLKMVFSAKRDVRLTYWQHFACAGIAGMTAKSLVAPLDVIKLRFQLGTPETRQGIRSTFLQMSKHEGIKSLWKGNFIGCARIVPYSILQVLFFQKMRLMLADDTGRLTSFTALVAGSGAGLFATLILYPTDVMKTRFVAQKKKLKYTSIKHIAKTMVLEEGFRGFYKGLFTSIIGAVPYASTMFLVYESVDQFPSPKDSFTPFYIFLSGCSATALAQLVSYPFDTVRKKLQAQCNHFVRDRRVDISTRSALEMFYVIMKTKGPFEFWKGSLVNLIKIIPYTAIMYVTYEMTKIYFLQRNGYLVGHFLDNQHELIDQSFKPEELEDFLQEIDALTEIDAINNIENINDIPPA